MHLKNDGLTVGELSITIAALIIIGFISLAFYLVDKIDFPSPQSETKEDVTNQIIKLK